MAKETEISVTRWLEVRDEVTANLKEVSPRTEAATRHKMAEGLIAAGFIDIQFISNAIDERNRKREEVAQRLLEERQAEKNRQAAQDSEVK